MQKFEKVLKHFNDQPMLHDFFCSYAIIKRGKTKARKQSRLFTHIYLIGQTNISSFFWRQIIYFHIDARGRFVLPEIEMNFYIEKEETNRHTHTEEESFDD